MSFYYLACPYAHKRDYVMQKRFEQVTKCLTELIEKGDVVFSPITHNHHTKVKGTWESHWRNFDFTFLRAASKLVVLQLEGWRESKGVSAEIEEAQRLGMKITYLTPK